MFSLRKRHEQENTKKWYVAEQQQTAGAAESEAPAAEAAIEDYLDHIFGRALALPYERRAELRRELRQHLAALVAAEQEEQGADGGAAVEAALRRFGDPRKIGRALRREWERTRTDVTFTEYRNRALAWFGTLTLLNLVTTTFLLCLPAEQQTRILVFWPTFMVAWVITGSPILAGWNLGRHAAPQRHAGRALLCAFALLVAGLEGVALLLSPLTESGGFWEIVQENCRWLGIFYVVWAPLGALSAALARRRWSFRFAR